MADAPVAFFVFKAILGFGLPLAIGIQQLVSIRRAIRRDREAAAAEAHDAAPATAPEVPMAEDAVRPRELEPA